jgi:hypothetical protein
VEASNEGFCGRAKKEGFWHAFTTPLCNLIFKSITPDIITKAVKVIK